MALRVAHLQAPGRQVDLRHLVVQAHVDAVLLAVVLRRASHEVVDRRHVASHEVRDAAGRVAGPRPLLESADLQVRLPASSEERRDGKECVSTCRYWWAP